MTSERNPLNAANSATKIRRGATRTATLLLLLTALAGCRVTKEDVRRWESTENGPRKLQAVLLHDKYEDDLRVEAALSLLRMKPRQGRRIGIEKMVDTLAAVPPDARLRLSGALVPDIITQLRQPPPSAPPGQPLPEDPSFAYKDAAYAMLTFERTVIIADQRLKDDLKAALTDWAMSDFERRLDNRTQAYGMEQLLRHIGPPAVSGLPKLMTTEARRLDQMATLVGELGDDKTKEAASTSLVSIAKYVTSSAWTKAKTPDLRAANAASKLEPTEKQFEQQLAAYQDEELFRVFGSMRKLGGRPAVDFLLSFASQKDQSEKRRQAALAALEGRLDRNNKEDIRRILQVVAADAPDVVLDQIFRRIGEMPREQVVDKLYELFRSEKWKVRRAAAATVLKMSTAKQIDEFMNHLPDGAKGFALSEALTYGTAFGDMKDGSPKQSLEKYFRSGSPAQRASALGYFYTFGTASDLPLLAGLESDSAKAPVCDTDPECKWVCDVKEGESKEIGTIGEYIRFCIVPAAKERQATAPK